MTITPGGETGAVPAEKLGSFSVLLMALNAVGTVWIFVLMLIILADVLGRTLFSSPLPGVPELVKLSIVGIVFLQIGYTLRSGKITQVDSLAKALHRRWPRAEDLIRGLYSLCGAALFVILFLSCWPVFVRAWTTDQFVGVEGYFTYPVWPIQLILLIGSACSAVQYLLFFGSAFRQAFGRRHVGA